MSFIFTLQPLSVLRGSLLACLLSSYVSPSLSWPFLGELSEAARVGHSWGKGDGLSKGGSLLRLVMYLCLFLFLSGRWPDAMGQTDREAYGSELCVSETRWVSSLWLETWSFRQWIWSLSRLLILRMALAPSVESLSTFEFLHDFMTFLIFYLPPSRQSGPWGAGSG